MVHGLQTTSIEPCIEAPQGPVGAYAADKTFWPEWQRAKAIEHLRICMHLVFQVDVFLAGFAREDSSFWTVPFGSRNWEPFWYVTHTCGFSHVMCILR